MPRGDQLGRQWRIISQKKSEPAMGRNGDIQKISILRLPDSPTLRFLYYHKDYAKFRGIIERANDAAVKRKTLEIVYYTMSRKKESRRKVDPYRVWFFNGTFYLIGHCHMRNEVRVFALDRIKMLHQTKESFEIPEGFSLEEFTGTSFGVFQGPLTKVKVWFSPDVAGYVKEKVWHESQKIHEEKDGSVVFEAVVAGTDEIRFWVMGWGSKAEVLEPASLREEIRAEVETILSKYGGELGRQKKTVRHQPR